MNCPCINCERKGCGAYHDQCKKFKKYTKEKTKIRNEKKKYNLNPRKRFENITDRMYYYRGVSIRPKV